MECVSLISQLQISDNNMSQGSNLKKFCGGIFATGRKMKKVSRKILTNV